MKYKLKISDIQEPGEGRKRVQKLTHQDVIRITDGWDFGDTHHNNTMKFINWFNNKFSEPMPVECDCKKVNITFNTTNKEQDWKAKINCSNCGGDGISHWKCYVYDVCKWDETLNYIESNWPGVEYPLCNHKEFGKKGWLYKGEELKFIVNPYVRIME